MNFDEQVAIITGSTTGIGYSIAKQLADSGAAVVINGRNANKVKEAVEEIHSSGGRAVGLAKPVEHPDTGQELLDLALRTFGNVSILINNAGIIHDQLTYKMSDHEFSHVLNVHVNGTFLCTRPFIKFLKQQKSSGHIINMTSTAGLEGTIGQINYSAAKAAINGMTWTLAKELKRDNILVNAIAPAALTNMTQPYIEKAKQKAAEGGQELPSYWNIGSSDEVASFVVHLLKTHDMKETGAIFGVNGKNIVRWNPPVSEPYFVNE
ncbi:SDR family NAD(P)-dependent oxidoreductase [Alkalihalobacterium alkalinitrilicum]|uniref:SDR family NAD(P)-dependent oxidoreductase n=1 Tax=Alkalihalobacterium alkalinitrilicum TaxID=427920 RepID=UPI00130300FE|nr:SDR family NAD(P)-dependent oxidoreductase [Alkalihalobacterium alkalinitrilicum]